MADSDWGLLPDEALAAAAGSQPHIYGESSGAQSQPNYLDYLQLPDVSSAIRRSISAGNEVESRFSVDALGALPKADYLNLRQLSEAVFSLVEKRLELRGIKSERLNEYTRWARPVSKDHAALWATFMRMPFQITAEELRSMLNLTPVTSTTVKQPGTETIYVRSFKFTIAEFRYILHLMVDKHYYNHECTFLWLGFIDDLEKDKVELEDVEWTVRYCGTTNGEAWDRHTGDMSKSSSTAPTWFLQFLKVVSEEFPHIIDDVEIDVVPSTFLSKLVTADHDLREQYLISMCGVGAMNMQAGGSNIVSSFLEEDRDAFQSLNTGLFFKQGLLSKLQPCSQEMRECVVNYGKEVQNYAKNNPESTGTDKRPFTSKLRDYIIKQATPAVVEPLQCALVTTIASDIGQDSHEDSTFYASGRRSADVVNKCFDILRNWESAVEGPLASGTSQTSLGSGDAYFTFGDIFAWPKKDKEDYTEAGTLLKSCLAATQPLIILTYGALPTYFALDSFGDLTQAGFYKNQRTENYQSTDNFIEKLGVPVLRQLGSDSGDYVVVIPSYHPGHLAQAGQPAASATRLFLYCHQVLWRAMHVALTAAEDSSLTRKQICEKIIADAHTLLDATPIQGQLYTFGIAFSHVKKTCADVTRGFNQGRVSRIRARKPDRKGKGKAVDSASGAPTEASDAKKVTGNRRLQISGTTLASEDAIGSYELSIRELMLGEDEAPKSARHQLKRRHVLSWSEPSQSDVLPKKQWTIGPLILPDIDGTWDDDSDSAKRYLSYTSEGVDIRDTAGKSLGQRKPLASGQSKTCTLPISMLIVSTELDDEAGQTFLTHWEHITGSGIVDVMCGALPGGPLSSDPLEGRYPASFFTSSPTQRAIPMVSAQSFHKNTKVWYMDNVINKTLIPANPGDMLWLFDRFFREQCHPETGLVFDLGSPSETPGSVYRALDSFCRKEKYRNHPYWRTLLAFAHLANTDITERNLVSNTVHLAIATLAKFTDGKLSLKIRTAASDKAVASSTMRYTVNSIERFYAGKVSDKNTELYFPVEVEELSYTASAIEQSDDDDDDAAGKIQKVDVKGKGKASDAGGGKRKRYDRQARDDASDDDSEMLFNRTSRTRKPVEESDDEMLLDAPVDTRKKAKPRPLRNVNTGGTSGGAANIGLSTPAVPESAAQSGSKAASKSAGPSEAADESSIWDVPEGDPASEPEMKKHCKGSKGAKKGGKK